MHPTIDIDFLKKQILMKGLTDQQVHYLKDLLILEAYSPSDIIIKENDLSTDLYLIGEGEVSVLKWDEDHSFQLPIGALTKGDMFGEMSFMDGSPRSSTIKAVKETMVLKLPQNALDTASIGAEEKREIETRLFANIALVNIDRLRASNKVYVNNLRKQLTYLQNRQESGQFLIYVFLILTAGVVIGSFFPVDSRAYIPWLFGIAPIMAMIKYNEFQWNQFGLHLKKWPLVIVSSVILSLCFLGVVYFIYQAFRLSPSEDWILSLKFLLMPSTVGNLAVYALFCFSQEFIARGVIQTSLQDFFDDEVGYKAVSITAVFLFFFQLQTGYQVAIYSFIGSLFLGYIFLKQRSILGVFLIHLIVGILITHIS